MSIPINSAGRTGDALKEFALSGDPKYKSDIKVGLRVAREIQGTLGGNTSYYFLRNSRFAKNRSMVAGRYDMSRFTDMLQLNGKFNYMNINWLPFHLVNTVISRKVGAWMMRNEKIVVTATDSLSEQQKIEQYEEIEFYLENKAKLEQLQKESGVELFPPEFQQIQDRDELDMWAEENNRLPEEIKAETGVNSNIAEEGLFTTVKERYLWDSASVGLLGLVTWMDDKGVVHNEYEKPENLIYSYSEFSDFRDTEWRGRVRSLKISELRRRYGQQFGGKLTEQQIFEFAQTAKEYQVPDKIRWLSEWSYSLMRPYDAWNIDILEFYVKSLDNDGYNMKVTRNGTLVMDRSKTPKLPEYNEYVEDDGWNMYRGIYARQKDMMLEWGIMPNQIKAQDLKEIGNVEFPISLYMYQNQDMRNIAIPEKVEKPFEQMCLTLLKIEQLVGKLRPIGAMVNVRALRELDLGLGEGPTKPLEIQKIYDQSGVLYYTDIDAEGNPVGNPITELANAGFREQAAGLMEMYNFHYQVLKDELGEDPNLAVQAAQPRVTEGNIQTSIQQADNATDYMFDAYKYLMEEGARKTACLMHDSISFGAKAYRHLLGQEDVRSRVFSTKVRMMPTEREIAVLEALINQSIAANPELTTFVNVFKIMRIARENVKLAEEYFRLGMKRMLQTQIAREQQNQQATFAAQNESNKTAEREKRKTKKKEGEVEILKAQMTGDAQAKNTILAGIMTMYQKQQETGAPMPPEMKALADAVINNVAMPALISNEQQKQDLIEKIRIDDEIDEMEEQQMQQPQNIMQ